MRTEATATASPTVAIGVFWKRPNDRVWLIRLREWSNNPDKHLSLPRTLRIKTTVEQMESIESALKWRGQMPNARLLVAVGFGRNEFANLQPFSVANGEPLLVVAEPPTGDKKVFPSASFLERRPVLFCGDAMSQIRKSVLRMTLRQRVSILSPNSLDELAAYFSLRYKVWSAAGFLCDQNKRSRLQWEIDYGDRTAIPLVAISTDGRTIGCTRLVRSVGREEEFYVSRVEELLARARDQILAGQFNFPHSPVHPFDVLEEFRGFRATFKAMIQKRIEMAEIGRVAVDQSKRGQGLAEALVDTAISLAERKCVSRLFLACPEALGPLLYERCGFSAVPGLRSDKFLNIAVPSIVMQRSI